MISENGKKMQNMKNTTDRRIKNMSIYVQKLPKESRMSKVTMTTKTDNKSIEKTADRTIKKCGPALKKLSE